MQQDHRNFHCWNYRRYVFEKSGFSPESELAYSTEKIQENFSNYSALHHRSIYIENSPKSIELLLEEEFLLVENAIFTEPDDQSAWWYHQFLIQFSIAHLPQNDEQNQLWNLILQQLETLQNLLNIEPESKWCMTGIVYLLHTILTNTLLKNLLRINDNSLLPSYQSKKEELLLKLMEIDPNHRVRYMYLLKN